MEYKDRTIDIFGTKWSIKFVDKIELEDEGSTVGLTDYSNKVISVITDQPREEISITLLHEIVHAILNAGQYISCSKDEPLVEFIARSFNSLIEQGVLQWKY